MIRTLIVDDDFRVADLHRAYTERIPGFTVVGQAGTGAEALRLLERTQPDLMLLDVYLPDMSGLDVLRALRESRRSVDVIAITAARDVNNLRSAMQGGVVHYLIKPFRFNAFAQRLESYAALRRRIGKISEADQQEVDGVYRLLQLGQVEMKLPKGLAMPTLDLVVRTLGEHELTAAEVAQRAGLSRVTARRYLDHLCQLGKVELGMRYGTPGRPEHRYRNISLALPAQ
jgi:response regulator of citrate/malate metabolism